MLTLADPRIRNIELEESAAPFVDLASFSPLISVDVSRKLISSRSDYFLWVREPVAARLLKASEALPDRFRLLVTEGYRPLAQQRASFARHAAELRDAHPKLDDDAIFDRASTYIAPPDVATHPTGAAVDLMLVNRDGSAADMGSVLNANDAESSGCCYTGSRFISRTAAVNRHVLECAMTSAGFVNYPSEWWHWSYGDRYWAAVIGQPNAFFGPVEEMELRSFGRC
ncbi:M15 family metallopeptidase [Paraburkholderia sediminicola]|uniref:M15 family metallopeptidase n=1 Tax=Paraburkholderia sediminicola TaxID=458836 RepID=UPI0038B955E9